MITKPKSLTWWIFAISVFLIFVVLQIPAAWLISKFYKNNQVLQNVSGNIWQGQADWHKGNLKGSLSWKTRPLDLFLLRLGAEIEVHSGNTQLDGVVGYGFGKKIIIRNLNGQVAPETLKSVVDWQWPTNAIQLRDIHFNFKKEQGFAQAEGTLQWAGGNLVYSYAQRQERMTMPSLQGKLSDENSQLIFEMGDLRGQKLIALALDKDLMLNVQLTQRLLLNIPSYQGKAGLDTYVISSRQPLLKGGSE
ncbi:MAG: type II secretion system protein N [Acinetobacter sp.]|uniref:Type II secretion system protein N n=1 Tax=Acinetobacter albensis TaxID=1673609 RepID=A0A1C4GVT1_9GAMM|nr:MULTISPECIES: type II secretion system protein N [Acinetobacter]ALD02539.1 general secretion pathway protein [Acinetobacter sp. TTH0-4]MBE9402079.1 type II secretion system protein N [Acinetobacter albensis]QPF38153.1 type II secretion system protein N [Acinetobacter sp. TTH0-4]SCC72314.1 type II secretion system protein N (GspN) [Acinetobacter albensis]